MKNAQSAPSVGVLHSLAPLVPPKRTIKKKVAFATRHFVRHPKNDVYLKVIKDYKRPSVLNELTFLINHYFIRHIHSMEIWNLFIHEVCDSPPLFKTIAHAS